MTRKIDAMLTEVERIGQLASDAIKRCQAALHEGKETVDLDDLKTQMRGAFDAYLEADSQIDRIRERVDLVALISETVRLDNRGKNSGGECPLCKGELYVSGMRKFFYCFECKQSGSVFDWIMQRDKAKFAVAVETAAQLVAGHLDE